MFVLLLLCSIDSHTFYLRSANAHLAAVITWIIHKTLYKTSFLLFLVYLYT